MTNNFHLQLKLAPIGAILVTYGDGPLPKGMSGKLLRLAYRGIRKHQRALYPDSPRVNGTHIQIKVGNDGPMGSWVSATVPRVVEIFDPIGHSKTARLYAYSMPFDKFEQRWIAEHAREYVGRPYDTLQLVGIALGEQKWVPKFMRNWLGERIQLPGRKEVCSTLAHRALLAGWQQSFHSTRDRPLGDRDPHDTCPADFENHPTFKLLAEYGFYKPTPTS